MRVRGSNTAQKEIIKSKNNNDLPKVSVIIPCYNQEKYIAECLDSVLAQTLTDFEAIVVNDGSTDKSAEIIAEYAKKDKRIKVISQNNKGVSVARNVGLEHASGKYILFCDPDDTFEINLAEVSYTEIQKQDDDIVCFGSYEVQESGRYPRQWEIDRLILGQPYTEDINLIIGTCHNVWNKIFKKSFLEENKIKFISHVKTMEDGIFCIECLLNNPKYRLLPIPLYNYTRTNPNSVTKKRKYLIENDINAFLAFEKKVDIKEIETPLKLAIFHKMIGGLYCYYRDNKNNQFRPLYKKQIKAHLKHLDETYGTETLKKVAIYNSLKELIFPNYWNKIFSIKNAPNKKHKIINIFGFKIKFKTKRLAEKERFRNLEKKINNISLQISNISKMLREKNDA